MKVLVVGSGGREHSLCWAIAKSPKCDELFCAPGNAGIDSIAVCVDIAADDIDALVNFATGNGIDFVVVVLKRHWSMVLLINWKPPTSRLLALMPRLPSLRDRRVS